MTSTANPVKTRRIAAGNYQVTAAGNAYSVTRAGKVWVTANGTKTAFAPTATLKAAKAAIAVHAGIAVNDALTAAAAAPEKRVKDNSEYAKMMRRLLRAYSRRLEIADPDELAVLIDLQADLAQVIKTAAQGMNAAGLSWAEIAEPLGISRQAAFQKWGH